MGRNLIMLLCTQMRCWLWSSRGSSMSWICQRDIQRLDDDYNRAIDLLDQDLMSEIAVEQSGFEQNSSNIPHLIQHPRNYCWIHCVSLGEYGICKKINQIAYKALRICQVLSKVFCDEAAEGASMTNLCFVCSKMGNEREAKEWEELARAVIGEVE
eukprot:gnl/Chilomastix_caulleri/4137.p1 GENE.gnl/Chilomastix_caulleri/4137~~gnl/Chilomastix_caulleri/4137.p1  ORF type:complete len:156 (+),score=20.74 gnl/Chilomastix_caulleri/4137:111-578(+)